MPAVGVLDIHALPPFIRSLCQKVPARPPAEAEFQELSLRALLLMLWRGRWIILICTAVMVGLGFKYVEKRGTIWRAQARLYIDSAAPPILSADGMMAGRNRNYANTQGELLRSTTVLGQALLKPEVAASPIFPEATNKVSWLKEKLKVSVGLKDDIVSVALDDHLVDEACLVVNTIVDTFRRRHSEKKNTTVRDLLQHMQGQRDTKEAALSILLTERTTFITENEHLALEDDSGASYALARLAQLTRALDTAETRARDARSKLAQAKLLEDRPALMREILEGRRGPNLHGRQSYE